MPEVRGGRRRDTSPRTEPQTANGPPPSKRSRTATSPKPPSTRTTRGSTVVNVKTGRKRDEPIKRERKNSPLVGTGPKKDQPMSGSIQNKKTCNQFCGETKIF